MIDLIPVLFQPYFVIALVSVCFILIYKDIIKPLFGFIVLAMIFVVFGILNSKELLAGFSNESIVSIALLILITAGIRTHFPIEQFLDSIFSKVKSYRHFLWIMMSKVSLLSSFINNTPVVALMTPYVFKWGKRNNVSPSKLLIPLSYATICGGMITVIGTSTNLVLNGFLTENEISRLNPYYLLIVGLLVTVGCILFISIFGNKLLPNRNDLIDEFERNKREYLVEKYLSSNSPLVGQSVIDAGLRNMKGVYLVEIVRESSIISPVQPTELLKPNDTLIFAGVTNSILDLTSNYKGLELPSATSKTSALKDANVIEVVIGANSSIVSKSIKAADFRNRYDAAVVALHRNGERLSGKIGEIELRSGDVLLLFAGNDFMNRVDIYKDLIVISDIDKPKSNKKTNAAIFSLISFLSIIAIPLGYSTLFMSLLIITTYMVATGLITLKTMKRDLDINMMLILILSLSIGQAIIKTNAGELIAGGILSIFQPYGNIAILLGLMIITVILTTFVTNVGAVAIMFPIALSLSTSLGLIDSPFYIGIAYAASAAFLSPIGYQTNLIIFGPGGYSFKDFFKIGLPVTLIYIAISFFSICLLYKDTLLMI